MFGSPLVPGVLFSQPPWGNGGIVKSEKTCSSEEVHVFYIHHITGTLHFILVLYGFLLPSYSFLGLQITLVFNFKTL
jgi:hypothetical protein